MDRKTAPPSTDLPPPWEWPPQQITKAQWQANRDLLMSLAGSGYGTRPDGWWLYEKGMDPPRNQTAVLYQMGELHGAELERVLGWWRAYYDDANELGDRTVYWRWDDIPAELVKKWDAQRRKRLEF
jgi:hypothetical protein